MPGRSPTIPSAIAAELGDTDGPLVVFMAGTGKEYGKTTGSRRAVPLRALVAEALEGLQGRRGLLFPAPAGGHIDIDNWRALWAAGRRLMLPSACPLERRKPRACRASLGSGSDGTRTRDLRRDRPAL